MTVKELIKYLETLPEDAIVNIVDEIDNNEALYSTSDDNIEYFKDNNVVAFGPKD